MSLTVKPNLIANHGRVDGTTIYQQSNENPVLTAIDDVIDLLGIISDSNSDSHDYRIGQLENSYVKLQEIQSQNTAAQSCSTSTWTKVNISTEVSDPENICTLSSSQFTLPAGTYNLRAIQPFHASSNSRIRLYNSSDSSVIDHGHTVYAEPGSLNNSTANAVLETRFTLAASKTLELQYYATATGYLGVTANVSGESEYRGQVVIQKVG